MVTQLLCAGLGGFIFGFTSSYIVLFTGIFGYLVLIMAALWAVNWKRADFRCVLPFLVLLSLLEGGWVPSFLRLSLVWCCSGICRHTSRPVAA